MQKESIQRDTRQLILPRRFTVVRMHSNAVSLENNRHFHSRVRSTVYMILITHIPTHQLVKGAFYSQIGFHGNQYNSLYLLVVILCLILHAVQNIKVLSKFLLDYINPYKPLQVFDIMYNYVKHFTLHYIITIVG